MDRGRGIGDIAWGNLEHAYGSAADVPGWIAGLRDPATAADCLGELYGYITHQGSRYSATSAAVPFLVEAALDRRVPDRAGIVGLVQFCAMGYVFDCLDWRYQRDRQDSDRWDREAWDAVVACHPELRVLLGDPDRAVAAEALMTLAWTGDASGPVQDAIRLAISSADGRDVCNGWLAAIIVGQAPDGVAAPSRPAAVDPVARFGQAAAALWFGGASAESLAADEVCAALAVPDALDAAESLMSHGAENVAIWVLAGTPDHVRPHANSRMLPIIAAGHIGGCEALRAYLALNLRGISRPISLPELIPAGTRDALAALLGPLESWRDNNTLDHRIYELEEYGLPPRRAALAAWLGIEHSA